MNREKDIHDKAIRLTEGGIVEVGGLFVRMRYAPNLDVPCQDCEMDSICYEGTTMGDVCAICDLITGKPCMLELANKKK